MNRSSPNVFQFLYIPEKLSTTNNIEVVVVVVVVIIIIIISEHSIRKHHVYHMTRQYIEWETPNSISIATTKALQSTRVQPAVVTGNNYSCIPA
jgi:hypothetical protein